MQPDLLEIEAPASLPDKQIEALAGQFMDDSHFDLLVSGNTVVKKPDGTPLLMYQDNALSRRLCNTAYDVFSKVAFHSANRGMAAGRVDGHRTRARRLKRDGIPTRTTYPAAELRSGIVGFFDRYPRIPFCRMTAFNIDHATEWDRALPFIRAVDRTFAVGAPDRYAAQRKMVNGISRDFTIHGTAFTTLTVNQTFRTALHVDKGDYRQGFGVLSVLEAGSYTGGYLVFPKYRVAVDMRTGGVLLADVHEAHGNTEIKGEPGQHVRLSLVFYARARMTACGSASEELARAKRLGAGAPRMARV